MKKTFIFAVITFIFSLNLSAGETAFNFLKICPLPQTAALGGSGTALEGNIYTIRNNPAGLASMKLPETGFSYNPLFEGMNSLYLSFCMPFSAGSLGMSIENLSVPSLQGYDSSGAKTDMVKSGDMLAGIAFGKYIGDNLSCGLTVKYLNETLESVNTHTFAADIGLLLKMNKITCGISINNLGPSVKFDNENAPLPSRLSLGAVYRFKKCLGLLGIEYPFFDKPSMDAGFQYNWFENFNLRAGMAKIGNSDYADSGLRFGFGLKALPPESLEDSINEIRFDYAWVQATRAEFSTHKIGISVVINQSSLEERKKLEIEKSLKTGNNYLNENKLNEAILEYLNVLDYDPANEQALNGITRCFGFFHKK